MNFNQIRLEVASLSKQALKDGKQVDTLFLGYKQTRAFLQSMYSQNNQFLPHPPEMRTAEGVKIIEVQVVDYIGIGYSVNGINSSGTPLEGENNNKSVPLVVGDKDTK